MDIEAYNYLEMGIEEPEIQKNSKDRHRSCSRGRRDNGGEENGEERASKRSRADESNGDDADRDRRHRDSERQHSNRDREKERHRSNRDREKERRNSQERDRKDRNDEKVRDREKEERDSDRRREEDRERERERETETKRSSSSRSRRHEIEVERDLERAKSRERARKREHDLEREIRERESRSKEKQESLEPEVDIERDQRTVFAFQMPLKAADRDVYEFFSQAGKVRDVRLITDRNSRRSKGVGYIEFYDVMAVPRAIALSGQPFFGQPVMVKPSEAEKNLAQSTASWGAAGAAAERKIYVGNLHFSIKEENLREIFEPFGPVEFVQLPLNQETGYSRGYGFVQFDQSEHAKAAITLNGKLDIAGRIIKVSAVTDHVGVQDTGTTATDFDDDNGGGLSLNARSRALLMQKLDRTGTASSIAESLGVHILNGSALLPAQRAPSMEPMVQPSECVLLKNMFDPRTETEPDFDVEIKEDVQEECSKFGLVKHIFVDKMSDGSVYLKFDSTAAAANCRQNMHGRWFAGRSISVTFMRPQDYDAKFGRCT